MRYILSGDIGGTKTLLQLCAVGSAQPLLRTTFASAAHDGLDSMIAALLAEAGIKEIAAACFALAGPVGGRVVQLTNLPWAVDGDALAARFGIGKVVLLNDFAAAGYGIEALRAEELYPLQAGAGQAAGTRLLVGAGTGLGVAWLAAQDGQYQVHATEAGHMDFAPNDEMQAMLLHYLRKQYGHVSYERVVSGPGLMAIYQCMRANGVAAPSALLLSALKEGDEAATLTHFALHENELIARMAVELFLAVYGAFVGNLALATLPRGGIYVAGGIAAKLHKQLAQGTFVEAYGAKGRFAALLQSLPLRVVLNENLGVLGANIVAQRNA